MIAAWAPACWRAGGRRLHRQHQTSPTLNAQAVASMQRMRLKQLAQTIETNYGKAIEWVKGIPDDQLQARRRSRR